MSERKNTHGPKSPSIHHDSETGQVNPEPRRGYNIPDSRSDIGSQVYSHRTHTDHHRDRSPLENTRRNVTSPSGSYSRYSQSGRYRRDFQEVDRYPRAETITGEGWRNTQHLNPSQRDFVPAGRKGPYSAGVQQSRSQTQPTAEGSQTPENKFCLYCGYDVTDEDECEGKKGYHQQCARINAPWCKEAVETFREFSNNKHVLSMAIDVRFLYGNTEAQDKKKKKEQRDFKIQELIKYVSALRNTNSGFLLIHLVGLDPKDNFTGAFDEFADVKLDGLINDGSLFSDVYVKKQLSGYRKHELKKFTDILVLYVEGSKALITSDFKTKVAFDDCIVNAQDLTLLEFVRKRRRFEEKYHKVNATCYENLSRLQESRHIQTKACWKPPTSDKTLVSDICDNLRLAEYISAFSKDKDGGSYLLGLAENPNNFGNYQSKKLTVTPVTIKSQRFVDDLIRERVSETCLVCDYDGNLTTNEAIVRTNFIRSRNPDNVGYVVHIAVRSACGIVFYDKGGPVAYKVDIQNQETNAVSRLTISEWFEAFRRRLD